MESKDTYRQTYDYITTLLKANCTDNVSIDYTKLDTNTRGELMKAINKVLVHRKAEIASVFLGTK